MANSDRSVAVVTGGSAGVGRAIVQELAAIGYDVAVIARGKAGVDAAVDEVHNAGQRGLGVQADVADADAIEDAAETIERELGPIDIWINNAFVGALRYSWDQTDEDFRRITDVTYAGSVHGMQSALRRMRPRNYGSIVNVSSALAHRGIPLQAAYCGAKHAIKGYTESVRVELGATGSAVTVSLATLPAVNTPQFDWNDNQLADEGHPMPVPPIYDPGVVARAIVELALHPRHDLWIGTSTVATVLGNRLAPAIVDWQLRRVGVSSQLDDTATRRFEANLYEPQDDDRDLGPRGSFSSQARHRDPVSWLSATIGRRAGRAVGHTLKAVDRVLQS